jgi:predicted transcriptional regulator
MKIIDAPQFGPMFRFNDANVYWTMHILSNGKRIGRKRLADEVGIGEGSMRRILDTLSEWDYISIKQTGIMITKSGQSFLEQIPIQPVDIYLEGSVIGSEQQGVVVKGVANKVNNGMEQRDAGIKVGAEGCTTIVYRDGNLMIPPDWNLDTERPEIAKKIREEYGMKAEDALIIGGGSTKQSAIIAAVSAALELF